MSDEARTPDAERIVVIRPARMPRGILVPMVLLILAGAGFAIRMGVSDWRGLAQETSRRWNRVFASLPAQAKPAPAPVAPKAIAQTPRPEEKAKRDEEKAKPAETAVAEAPKVNAAWDDIRRAADKARNDQKEAERIKEEADRKIAETTPPPPRVRRGIRPMDPAAIAAIRKQQLDMMRHMQEMMGRQQGDFNQIVRQQLEAQKRFMDDIARNRPGVGARPGVEEWPPRFRIPPGFEGFARPLPGMDRMNEPLPGQPRIQERSGEEVRDGVKRVWKSRVIVISPEGFAAAR